MLFRSDVVNFYELVLFSFLTGNADMHLKNFSLLHTPGQGYGLAPAHDLMATALVKLADMEELALTLNDKKKKLRQEDFLAATRRAGVEDKVMTGVFSRFIRVRPAWEKLLAESFLPAKLKEGYLALLQRKFEQLELA